VTLERFSTDRLEKEEASEIRILLPHFQFLRGEEAELVLGAQ